MDGKEQLQGPEFSTRTFPISEEEVRQTMLNPEASPTSTVPDDTRLSDPIPIIQPKLSLVATTESSKKDSRKLETRKRPCPSECVAEQEMIPSSIVRRTQCSYHKVASASHEDLMEHMDLSEHGFVVQHLLTGSATPNKLRNRTAQGATAFKCDSSNLEAFPGRQIEMQLSGRHEESHCDKAVASRPNASKLKSANAKKAQAALMLAKAKLLQAQNRQKVLLSDQPNEDRASLRHLTPRIPSSRVKLPPISALHSERLDNLVIKEISASGPAELVRFGESQVTIDGTRAEKLRRKHDLERKTMELKAKLCRLEQSGKRDGQRITWDSATNEHTHRPENVKAKPLSIIPHSQAEEPPGKIQSKQLGKKELIKLHDQAQHRRDVTYMKHLISKQRPFLLQQQERIQETNRAIQLLESQIDKGSRDMAETSYKIKDWICREEVLSNIAEETASKLMAARKALHDFKKQQST